VDEYYRKLAGAQERARQRQEELRREKRLAAKEAPGRQIEEVAAERLRWLERATKRPRGDKLLEQIMGREEEITLFWKAIELARLSLKRDPTDAEVAAQFVQLPGAPATFTRHQARSRRKLIDRLNKKELVWLPLCRKELLVGK
jgi:hypothetical protein